MSKTDKHTIIIEIEVRDDTAANLMDIWPTIRAALPATVLDGQVNLWLDSKEYTESIRQDEREKYAPMIMALTEELLVARAEERERIAAAIDRMHARRYSSEGYWTKVVSDALDDAAAAARRGGRE